MCREGQHRRNLHGGVVADFTSRHLSRALARLLEGCPERRDGTGPLVRDFLHLKEAAWQRVAAAPLTANVQAGLIRCLEGKLRRTRVSTDRQELVGRRGKVEIPPAVARRCPEPDRHAIFIIDRRSEESILWHDEHALTAHCRIPGENKRRSCGRHRPGAAGLPPAADRRTGRRHVDVLLSVEPRCKLHRETERQQVPTRSRGRTAAQRDEALAVGQRGIASDRRSHPIAARIVQEGERVCRPVVGNQARLCARCGAGVEPDPCRRQIRRLRRVRVLQRERLTGSGPPIRQDRFSRHGRLRNRQHREAAVGVQPGAAGFRPETRVQRLIRRQRTGDQVRRLVDLAAVHQIVGAAGRPDVEVVRLRVRHARPAERLGQIGVGRPVRRECQHRRKLHGCVVADFTSCGRDRAVAMLLERCPERRNGATRPVRDFLYLEAARQRVAAAPIAGD